MGGDHLWDAIGAAGQTLGSVAVLISIAYLALQVRHARDAIGLSIQQSRADLNIRLMMNRATDETLRRTVLKMNTALASPRQPFVDAAMQQAGLTEEEALCVHFDLWAWWVARTQTILNIHQFPASERAEHDRNARMLYGTQPVGRLWYETQKADLNPEAVRYVDNLLAQPG